MGFAFDDEPEWMTEELKPHYLNKDAIIKDVVTGKVFRVENDCIIIGRASSEGGGPRMPPLRRTLPGATSPGSPWKNVGLPFTISSGSSEQLHPPLPPVPPEPSYSSEEGAQSPFDDF